MRLEYDCYDDPDEEGTPPCGLESDFNQYSSMFHDPVLLSAATLKIRFLEFPPRINPCLDPETNLSTFQINKIPTEQLERGA